MEGEGGSKRPLEDLSEDRLTKLIKVEKTSPPREEDPAGPNVSSPTEVVKTEGQGGRRARKSFAEGIDFVVSRPITEAGYANKRGNPAEIPCQPVQLVTNFFRTVMPHWQIFVHHVTMEPEIPFTREKMWLLAQHKEVLPPWYTFNGTVLYSLSPVPEQCLMLNSVRKEGSPVKITIQSPPNVITSNDLNPDTMMVFNSIMKNAMAQMELTRLGSNYYRSEKSWHFNSRRLDVWPGIEAIMRLHDGGLLMQVNTLSKVIRQDTVYDFIRENQRDEGFLKAELIGAIVMTKYNGKTYRVSGIAWDQNPASTFDMGGQQIQFRQYVLQKYGPKFKCQNVDQPILYSKAKKKEIRRGMPENLALIPEFCVMTGLSDQQTKDFGLMKELAIALQRGPSQRAREYMDFKDMLKMPRVQQVLNPVRFAVSESLLEIQGRRFNPEVIYLGTRQVQPNNYDWTRDLTQQGAGMKETVPLVKWIVISPQNVSGIETFVHLVKDKANRMNFQMDNPRFETFHGSPRNPEALVTKLEECIQYYGSKGLQLLMVVLPTDDESLYAHIKRKCIFEYGILSQCVKARNVNDNRGKSNKVDGVATKLAVQLNAKLGGVPWEVKIPLSATMIVGFNTSTQEKGRLTGGKTFGALVATTNNAGSKFYSHSFEYDKADFTNVLRKYIVMALRTWYNANERKLPVRIIFYRDGVSEGELQVINQEESVQLKAAISDTYKVRKVEEPNFGFIVVNKRPGAKVFIRAGSDCQNPQPGTVVDSEITFPERLDFYLVAAKGTGQGTVTPVSYNVLVDQINLTPAKLQLLTYKLTHLYYNWCSMVRVPAVCQYARKLASLMAVINKHRGCPENDVETLKQRLHYL